MSGVPDYTLEDILDFKFTTRQFSTGAPFAFASGVIEIYEDNSITQITAAETLTLEFDGVTGLHNLRVEATAANGFENGKSYHCVVSAGTVDSVSVVGEVVQQFSIGRSAAAADLANGTDGLGAIKAETATILVDTGTTLDAAIAVIDTNVDQIETAVITNAAGVDIAADIIAVKAETAAIVNDTDLIDDGTSGLVKIATDVAAILVDTATTIPGTITTIDSNVDAILVDTGTTLQAELDAIQAAVITNAAGVDIAADIIALKAETVLIVADTNELQTDDVPGLIATLDTVVDTVKAETALIVADTNELQTDNIPGTLSSMDGKLDTIDNFLDTEIAAITAAVITNAAGVDIAADIIAVKAETAAIVNDTDLIDDGTSGLVKIASDVSAILVDTGTTLQAELDGIQADTENIQTRLPTVLIGGRMDSDVEAINNDTDAADKLAAHALETLPVTFTTVGGSTTAAILNLVDGGAASSTNDVYNGRILVFNNSTLNHQVTEITDYVGSTKTATITAITTAPTSTHTARMI